MLEVEGVQYQVIIKTTIKEEKKWTEQERQLDPNREYKAFELVSSPLQHPLRTKPFLFAGLPLVNQQQIKLLIGDLATAWGLGDLNLPRLTIRTAQELGINILHYAWKRRQLIGLQQEDNSGQW